MIWFGLKSTTNRLQKICLTNPTAVTKVLLWTLASRGHRHSLCHEAQIYKTVPKKRPKLWNRIDLSRRWSKCTRYTVEKITENVQTVQPKHTFWECRYTSQRTPVHIPSQRTALPWSEDRRTALPPYCSQRTRVQDIDQKIVIKKSKNIVQHWSKKCDQVISWSKKMWSSDPRKCDQEIQKKMWWRNPKENHCSSNRSAQRTTTSTTNSTAALKPKYA